MSGYIDTNMGEEPPQFLPSGDSLTDVALEIDGHVLATATVRHYEPIFYYLPKGLQEMFPHWGNGRLDALSHIDLCKVLMTREYRPLLGLSDDQARTAVDSCLTLSCDYKLRAFEVAMLWIADLKDTADCNRAYGSNLPYCDFWEWLCGEWKPRQKRRSEIVQEQRAPATISIAR